MSHGRRPSSAGASSRGSGGSSSGWVVKRTDSKTYSDGGRTHHGISLRHARHTVSRRHSSPTNPTSPPSISISPVRGKRSRMPWQRIEAKCPCMPEPQSAWYSP